MFKSDGTRRDFPLKKARTVIGRKSTCDLRIPLTSVSRQHCEIVVDDNGTPQLRDLGSSNGTFHNSNRVQKTELSAGDELVVGPVVFVVVIDGVPQDISPVRTIVNSTGGARNGADMTESGSAALSEPEVPMDELVFEEDQDREDEQTIDLREHDEPSLASESESEPQSKSKSASGAASGAGASSAKGGGAKGAGSAASDDPIAALEAMAEAEAREAAGESSQGRDASKDSDSDSDSGEGSDDDLDIELLESGDDSSDDDIELLAIDFEDEDDNQRQ